MSASLVKRDEGRKMIEQGRAVIEEMYGPEHACMHKYYSFIAL